MLSVPSSKMPSHVSKTPNLRKARSNHILRAEMPSDWNPPDQPPSWILLLASSQIPPFLELNWTWRLNNITAVTVIWVSPCFGYPHTQIPSEMGIPFQYGCRVFGIPRYPPGIPRTLVNLVSPLTCELNFAGNLK